MKEKLEFSKNDLLALEKNLIKLRTKELQAYMFYHRKSHKFLLMDFLEGALKGIGFSIGASVIITVAGILLTQYLGNLPVVGDSLSSFGIWLEEERNDSNK